MGGASKLLMLLSTPFPLLYPRPAALRLARPSRFPFSPLSTLSSPAFFPHTPSSPSHPRPPLSARAGEPHGTPAVITQSFTDLPGSRPSHPWPEWSNLVDHLTARCYSPRQLPPGEDDDSFAVDGEVPGEFVRAAETCLSFARDRPDVLRLLSKKDIQVIVENGSPLLFKNGANSVRRMRSFVSGLSAVWDSDKAQTVDIMRYLLSYAYSSLATSGKNSFRATEPTEASARSLLNELVNVSGTVQESSFTMSTPRQTPFRPEQFSRPPGQNIEMKRGDWICSKCSFMNFARNIKCLECNDERPKRQLTGGEWECPQCDFFNYGRNMSCLRCDCKRPGEAPIPRTSSGSAGTSSFEQILNRSNTNKSELERKLAANDEKAEKWFSKVANLDDASDLSRAAADEDFPEIMPLRKGVNRFVVSTRKTPLERRLANAQYEGNASQSEKTTESSISQSLDRILGRTSSPSSNNPQNQRRDPDSVPFVPLPPDMFTKKSDSEKDASSSDSPSAFSGNPIESKTTTEPSDASERWSKKVAELDSATDLASAISDEDFPEIMPMRKGENRFVVSKKKDRSLTSPQYKRRLAMEQANNSDFVDFVPFPPDYFAKKDKQPEATGVSTPPQQVLSVTEKLPETKHVGYNEGRMETSYGRPTTDPVQPINYSQDHSKDSWASEATQNNSTFSASSAPRTSQPAESSQKAWKYSGKSLEGSAVKEPDPLDMSEEAKAERWFRRVAQIKDISELSQIPDEDFPEIMPMRKGVNRFVVSKRKTPLERRLTSPQYRRNLPTVSSEPEKDSE